MLIRRIKPEGLLSFGPDTQALELGPLNVLIGPNGSGKSNLIEAIGLLQAAPRDLTAPIREGGGIRDWIWQGEPKAASAHIEVILENPKGPRALRYQLRFAEQGQRFELTDERIESEQPGAADHHKPDIYFNAHGGRAVLTDKDARQHELRPEEIDPEQSILAQRKDPDHYPELNPAVPRVVLRSLYAAAPAPKGRPAQRFLGRGRQEPGAGPESVETGGEG